MAWLLVLLVCLVGVLAAAATEVALMRFRNGWSPRRRVFTAAVVGPSVMLVSPLLLIAGSMALATDGRAGNLTMTAILTVGVAASLAAFIGGLVVAFALERTFQP